MIDPEVDEQRSIEQYKQILEANIKLAAFQHEKGAAYTKLVTALGYAAIFSLWSSTRVYLTKRQSLATAVLMLISLCVFVIFEIYKMQTTTTTTRRRARVLVEQSQACGSLDPMVLIHGIQVMELENERDELRSVKYWRVALYVSLGTGLAGAAVLLASFVVQLVRS